MDLIPCDRYGNASGEPSLILFSMGEGLYGAEVTVGSPYSSWFIINDVEEKKIITLYDNNAEINFNGEDYCRRAYPTLDPENDDVICNVTDILVRDSNGDPICSNEELSMWCDILDNANTDDRVCEISTAIMEEI